MEISGIVQYEALHRLDLVHPATEQPLGITFMIRSAGSKPAKDVLRKHIDEMYERQQRGKLIKGSQREAQELEKAASYIASWDWGSNTYDGKKPELSIKTAAAIMDKEGWIFDQVTGAANNIRNFSESLPTNSPDT